MITNFETITEDLTADEKVLVPMIINNIKLFTEHNPVKSPEFIKQINRKLDEIGLKQQIRDVKFRKLVNFIRSSGMLPIIATSEGYYYTEDGNEILKQIKSMRERANSINNAADGMELWLMKNQ